METGLIPTLDSAGNAIIKSDNLISDRLRHELVGAFETLRADQAANVDWHPRSNDMVQNLVHPSMYPFVFGMYLSSSAFTTKIPNGMRIKRPVQVS